VLKWTVFLDCGKCSQCVTTIVKCTEIFGEHRGTVRSSYPGLVNAAMSNQTESSEAVGVVNNTDASNDPQYQLFVGLMKKKLAKMSFSGIA
jgi:hypothetical protein